jgi:type IV secretory pathway component VirB8
MAGIEAELTIWRVIFVSGRMEATTSTIWKRACLAVMIAFCPVIIIIGMAPR